MRDELDDYADAIAAIESSGNHRAIGPPTRTGDRAIGLHQVMATNVPRWTEEAGLGRMTPYEFWQDEEAQRAVFRHRFGSYVERYGNPYDAASMWFTGRPLAQGGYASDGYINGNEYVRRFSAALGRGGGYHRDRQPIDFASFGEAGGEQGKPIDFAAFGESQGAKTASTGPDQRSSHLGEADAAMRLNPQEKALYQRHLSNLYGSGGIDQPDGSRSSLLQTTAGFGDKTYNLPTVYDGKQLSPEDAVARARKEGLENFPSYKSPEEAQGRYDEMHSYMDRDTADFLKGRGTAPSGRPGTEIDVSQFGAP